MMNVIFFIFSLICTLIFVSVGCNRDKSHKTVTINAILALFFSIIMLFNLFPTLEYISQDMTESDTNNTQIENQNSENNPQIIEDKDGNKYVIIYNEDGNPTVTVIK